MGCTLLKEMILPHLARKIGVSAFKSCNELKSVVVKGDLDIVMQKAFCTKLRTIGLDRIRKIGKDTFLNVNIK